MGIITISRGSYSKGKDIAEKLAKKMGYECISREILLEASKQFNVPKVKLTQALKNAPSILDRIKYGRKRYIAFIKEALLEHISKDNVVYHGFAGHFFTQNIPNILKVRIIADISNRVEMVMKQENLSEKNARKLINRVDEERRKWSLYLYGIDTNDPELYDIVLRADCLEISGTVATIQDIASCKCFQMTEKSKMQLQDMLFAAKAHTYIVKKYPESVVTSKDGELFVTVESSLALEDEIIETVPKLLKKMKGVKGIKTSVTPFEMY